MRRWGLLVALLYGVVLIIVTFPAVYLFLDEGPKQTVVLFEYPLFWAYIGVSILCQALFLFVRIDKGNRRPLVRRPVRLPIIISGFLLGLLLFGAYLSLHEFLYGEADPAPQVLWSAVGASFAIWIFWIAAFFFITVGGGPFETLTNQARWLFRGSILELLIAVPTHIYARQQKYCCAGIYTFTGIATGISIMLFSFGPGVFILFYERWKRLQAGKSNE